MNNRSRQLVVVEEYMDKYYSFLEWAYSCAPAGSIIQWNFIYRKTNFRLRRNR